MNALVFLPVVNLDFYASLALLSKTQRCRQPWIESRCLCSELAYRNADTANIGGSFFLCFFVGQYLL